MAKIKVGDIEIDGSQITIGGQVVTRPNQTPPTPPLHQQELVRYQPPTPRPNNDLAKLPGQPLHWTFAGLGVLLFTALVAPVPFFGFLGIGMTVLGALKQRAHQEEHKSALLLEEKKLLQLEATFAPTKERLRQILREASEPLTLEQISQQVRLSQTELVRGLAMLRDQGEVTEDLNIDSGEWVYALAQKQLPSQNLDARLAALEAQEVTTRNR